jgi:hypothetical protein
MFLVFVNFVQAITRLMVQPHDVRDYVLQASLQVKRKGSLAAAGLSLRRHCRHSPPAARKTGRAAMADDFEPHFPD